ncbi:MAG: YihY/virulence factor BrkB family protein [Bryobacteraceae bacterium]|nr:YihY/virulence factor BrkB family protein [Bryobacteraceae bacterium]
MYTRSIRLTQQPYSLWPILRHTWLAWNLHDAPRLGAALAFYTILSMAPLVILVVAFAAAFLGYSAAQDQLLSQVRDLIGQAGADAVKVTIEHAQEPSSGLFASAVGLVTLFFGASGVFLELRSALNTIWQVPPAEQMRFGDFLKQRFFSFGMVLAIGFLLLVSLVLSAALAAAGKFFDTWLPVPESVLTSLNFLVSFAATAVLFALIFKYVPDKSIPWREVRVGAIVTAFLFTVGKALIGLYLGKASVGSAYGAAGSLVVVIVWVYYSSQLFFLGAEFTHALAHHQREGSGDMRA